MRQPIQGLVALLGLSLAGAACAQQAIDLPGDKLHPESVSITPDGTAYVGSMNGGVLRLKLSGGKADFLVKPGAYGSGALFGVLADEKNKLLWTCTNDFTARGVTVPGSDKGSWLKGFDLKTGEGKVNLAIPAAGSICNDMAVGKDGSVYVADTGHPRILRWKPGAAALETWVEDPILGGGLDGLAFGADGHIIINNVRTGALYRVAVASDGKAGAVTKLTTSRPLGSPDGMRPMGGNSFAVAESQGRVSKLTVNGDTVEVTTLAEGINPTGLDVHGGTIWHVQGQLGALFNPGTQKTVLPFRLMPVPAR